VFVEAKHADRDQRLKEAYRDAYENGYRFIPVENLRPRLASAELNIADKKRGIPGLQLADMIAAPALAQCIMKHFDPVRVPQGMHGQIAELLESQKFYRDKNGSPKGYGRIWRPK